MLVLNKEAFMTTFQLNLDKKALSHELMIPLTGILGMVELWKSDELTETEKERLLLLEQAGNRLLVIARKILNDAIEERSDTQTKIFAMKFFK